MERRHTFMSCLVCWSMYAIPRNEIREFFVTAPPDRPLVGRAPYVNPVTVAVSRETGMLIECPGCHVPLDVALHATEPIND